MPLINSVGCYEAYIHYICKINFQACDPQLDQTITICRKVCEQFVSKCETHPKEICASLPVCEDKITDFFCSDGCFSDFFCVNGKELPGNAA